MVLKLTSFTGF